MLTLIIEIAATLRRSGWPVSNGEITDFFQALRLVDCSREDMLTAALCTLAKDKQSLAYLAALLNQRWQETNANNEIIPGALNIEKLLANPPHLPAAVFAQRLEELKNSIRREIGGQAPAPARRGAGGKGGGAGAGWRQSASPEAAASGASSAKHTAADADRKAEPDRDATAWPNPNHRQPLVPPPSAPPPLAVNLRYLDLAAANQEQLAEIYKLLAGLGKKLAGRPGYRKKPSPSGALDIRRTARKTMACGGLPLVLKKERRIISRPLIVTLCDLSGSVAPYSEFFLQLLTALRRRCKDLRSFAFVDQVADITGLINQPVHSWTLSAQEILRTSPISQTGFSHYGQVWECFYNQYREALTPRTTVIILGDARNNWQPEGADIFHSISDLCRRVLWLNPMPREKWSAGDCVIDAYAPYCSAVRECRNAMQLAQMIREII